MTLEQIRKEISKRFNKIAYMHKAKQGFNLLILDNKENEVLNFLKDKNVTIVENEKGVNWENRNWIEYYVEVRN